MSTTILRGAALAASLLPCIALAEPLSFDQALRLAAGRSQSAHAAQASASSARESARMAGQLPDPMLRASVENLPVTGPDRYSTTSEPMTMKRIGISQEWIPADKRAARESAAQAVADREAVQEEVAVADARLQAALAYLDAWYADEGLKLSQQAEHHLREEVEAARSRMAAAAGNGAEVLQLSAARGAAEDESHEARQQQAAALVSLQRWVGFLPDALTAKPALEIPPEQDYLARHPAVAALRHSAEVARRNATVAAKERSPNWTWEVGYAQRTGYSDLVTVGVSIPLQIAPAERQDRETAARLALVDKTEAEIAEATRAAQADYRVLASDASRLAQRLERYRSAVLAPAQQRTAAVMAAYRSGQSPLSALFEARHAQLEAQRKLLALQKELARTQAQLMFKPLVAQAQAEGGPQ